MVYTNEATYDDLHCYVGEIILLFSSLIGQEVLIICHHYLLYYFTFIYILYSIVYSPKPLSVLVNVHISKFIYHQRCNIEMMVNNILIQKCQK